MRQPADGVGRVRPAPVGPGMAPGPTHRHPEPAAAQGSVDDTSQAPAIDGDERLGVSQRAAFLKKVLDAAKVATTLLSDREGEEDRTVWPHTSIGDGAQHRERYRQPACVVRHPGTDPAIARASNLDLYLGTEHRVEVRRHDDGTGSGGFAVAGAAGEQVTHLVARNGVSDMLEMSTAEIEGIEVYPGPATLPAEFNHPGVKCAVVIWTRRGG